MPTTKKSIPLTDDPLWYKDAVFYELHVRAFCDSNGDGIGDFKGLTSKLDYLQDLGVTVLWLLPFCPSPGRDDGYDTSDYTNVNPDYGTLQDVKQFLKEAHRRGLRVVSELVLNHTSDQHAWFQRARRAKPGSRARDFYVWSDTPDRYADARIIFKDFETSNWTWDPVAKAYYWHRFYSHQPDLNFESPHVRRSLMKVVDFWFALGVDGLRLDAVPYLFEREGTNCENLPETHGFLRELRAHVDVRFSNRMLLAEANQWPEEAVAYFGNGDECQMAFHFPLMPRLFMATRLEQRFPIVEILQQTPAIHETSQWAVFLRNHDELTLEMVTDEERDYMYRVYAGDPRMRINLGIRRRLAPLLGNNRRKIELLNGLLFSMPGTPVLYYGDEIGMGDNIYLGDRNGVRTPMQWSSDRNAGFSRANPQRLYLPAIIDPEFHFEALNVEAQQNNPSSMLWWTKRLIAMRKRYRAFGRGRIEFLEPENRKVLVFLRQHEQETILVIANLSRFAQCVELDLSRFRGHVPIETFGQTRFPSIGELPYFLTLGPHAFYWFLLEPQVAPAPETVPSHVALPELVLAGSWSDLLHPGTHAAAELEKLLPAYLRGRRWFGKKAHTIQGVTITDSIPVSDRASIVLVRVDYADAESEIYALPLAFVTGGAGDEHGPVARLHSGADGDGVLSGATADIEFQGLLLDAISRRRRFRGVTGEIVAGATRALDRVAVAQAPAPTILRAEQSNTSVRFGQNLILKFFRRVESGVNPDLEIGRFLTERGEFEHIAPLAGYLEYRGANGDRMSLALLQRFVPNEGDAWSYTLESLTRYFERTQAQAADFRLAAPGSLVERASGPLPPEICEILGTYASMAQLLGERTAQMHVALGSDNENPDFAPEAFTALYQRSMYQSMRSLTTQTLDLLSRKSAGLPDDVAPRAQALLEQREEILRRFQPLVDLRISAQRIRCHGDYHLGQVLHTGRDFVIIDFEGEPASSLSERRLKRSPLRDVAGMLRSFHYAASVGLVGTGGQAAMAREDRAKLEPWVDLWYDWTSAAFLRSYVTVAARTVFLPPEPGELGVLLDVYLLEKALYELKYELNNRPDWVRIPLRGISQLLGATALSAG